MASVPIKKQTSDSITDTYLTIERKFSKLFEKCETEDQKDQLRNLHADARSAWLTQIRNDLRANTPGIKDAIKDLSKANADLKAALKTVKNIVNALNMITEAVRLAGSLAKMAGTGA